jgi:hypothetical protein
MPGTDVALEIDAGIVRRVKATTVTGLLTRDARRYRRASAVGSPFSAKGRETGRRCHFSQDRRRKLCWKGGHR